MIRNDATQLLDGIVAQEQQIFGLCGGIIPGLHLELDGSQSLLNSWLRLLKALLLQLLGQDRNNVASSHAEFLLAQETGVGEGKAGGALKALAGNTAATDATKHGIFGSAGVITIETGRREVLNDVELNELGHGTQKEKNWSEEVRRRKECWP